MARKRKLPTMTTAEQDEQEGALAHAAQALSNTLVHLHDVEDEIRAALALTDKAIRRIYERIYPRS